MAKVYICTVFQHNHPVYQGVCLTVQWKTGSTLTASDVLHLKPTPKCLPKGTVLMGHKNWNGMYVASVMSTFSGAGLNTWQQILVWSYFLHLLCILRW